MAKVIPSINCGYKDTKGVAARCRETESIFEKAGVPPRERWAHFDVADGAFTFHKSWDEPERLAEIQPQFQIEVHLMVEDQKPVAERWLAAGAKRVIVHVESALPELFAEIAAIAHDAEAEIALALNPETSLVTATPYFTLADSFLILAVHPGLSGQKFLPSALEKVFSLRRELPNAKIEIDGGMNPDTARAAVAAGADTLVSGSDIFGNPDPEGEYEILRSL